MHRYVIFAFNSKKPMGGWDDLDSFHETLKEAQKVAKKINKDVRQIVDLSEERIVEIQEKEQ